MGYPRSPLLGKIGTYLSFPSLLLHSIFDDKSGEPSDVSNLIVSSSSDVLDFGDLEKEVAARLKDEDLRGVLKCVNLSSLTTLKLTNCINIIGHGLEPLRNANAIKQIDLTLVGRHESAKSVSESCKLSEEAVYPILRGIIDEEGNSLRSLTFPHKWMARLGNNGAHTQG